MERAHVLPAGAFALASLIWGSTFLAIRFGNETVPPVWGATLRLVLACALLALVAIALKQPWPRGPALKAAVLFGVLNMGVGLGLLYWGEQTVASGTAAVLYATVPLSTFAMGAMLGIERPTLRGVLGAVAAVVGVGVVFAGELTAESPIVGLLAILGAATAAALAGLMLKRAPAPAAIPVNAIGCAVGAALLGVASVALGEPRALPSGVAGWWPVVYLAIFGSMGAYVLWTWLLRRWPASSASMVAVVVPVLAVFLGALVAHERPPLLTYAGAAIVLSGVLIVLRAPKPAARASAAGASGQPRS